MKFGLVALVASAALLAACSGDPAPVYQPEPPPAPLAREYDASLEPSAAVLTLVPLTAQTLEVTDFDQSRLLLGFGASVSQWSEADRSKFAQQLPTMAVFSTGMLRPFDARLRRNFGFGADDVAWEASYAGGATGWVLALGEKVPMGSVQRAVAAKVGPLAGAVVDTTHRLVTSAAQPDVTESWASEASLVALGGRSAASTYFHRACLPFDTVFGAGMKEQLAAVPATTLRSLQQLDAFAVALGGELATVQLGANRTDAFERLRLADVMPRTKPDFGDALGRGVADPATGRLGYELGDAVTAAKLVREQRLPFAVCAD